MNNYDPKFLTHFKWAVIRLATLQSERMEKGRLLFATVTLLAADRHPPSKMIGCERQKIGKSGMTVFFRRSILNAQEAVNWYRSLEADQKTPTPSRQEDIEIDKDGIPISLTELADDPIWPNLGLPMGEGLIAQASGRSNPAPFIGCSTSRVHRRFGSAEGFESFLDNDQALTFIARRLHINLKEYKEYLGSAALVVPDPIIRQIDNFMIPSGDGRGERIFYRFVPRPGQSLEGVKIAMFDEQALLLSSFESKDVPLDGILDIDKGSCLGAYGYIATHPVHGVLTYQRSAGFLRQVSLNMGIVKQVRNVSVPISESSKSPQLEFRVHRTQNDRSSTSGHAPTTPNINARVRMAERQREKAFNAARYDQRWFGNNSRLDAMDFVRTRIGRARNRILIADPYFGVLQVPQNLLAITSDTVKISILTSRLAFEGTSDAKENPENQDASVAVDTVANRLKRFHVHIERIKKEGNADIEVMVLLGKSPVLHDRFLVVDDDVWFLGNSLNALGERASMIIKLPDPDAVLYELEKMMTQAESFQNYLKKQIAKMGTASK